MLSIVVAVSQNNVIGKNNRLPWHLPADLKRFKTLTMGHHLIMGRKTYESIGKPLPGRTTIIITRNRSYKVEGCIVTDSLDKAIGAAKHDPEIFIIGGAAIIEQALPLADKIYLTRIHANVEGDVFFSNFDLSEWKEVKRVDVQAGAVHEYSYSYIDLERKV